MSQICLMDMRAQETLNTGDDKVFQMFIIGGILGDNPPRDRTFGLRKDF